MTTHYGKIMIWCYKCGHRWFGLDVVDLYNTFARCPNIINRGGNQVQKCEGFTDGIEQRKAK